MADRVGETSPEAILKQLHRILGSPEFDASDRNRRFLAYVVEESLAGRAERIKAYTVATDALGRAATFDPQLDPVVRIEAGRLRRALERYYLTAGIEDPVRITVPKGSYAPAFSNAGPAAKQGAESGGDACREGDSPHAHPPESAPPEPRPSRRSGLLLSISASVVATSLVWLAAAWIAGLGPFTTTAADPPARRHGPAVFVASFTEDGDATALPNLAPGFTRAVIGALTRFQDLFVFGPETSFHYDRPDGLRGAVEDLEVDFILTGSTVAFGDRFAIEVVLVDAKSQRNLWAARFDGLLSAENILRVRDEVADRVARSLAQPYGVIFTNRVREREGKAPGALSSYDCLIGFYRYWKTYRREEYQPVRACLEQAIRTDPEYAEAWAALSLAYSDAYRFGFDDGTISGDPRREALRFAQRAIDLAPDSARGHHALAVVYWHMNDVERSLDAERTGLGLNPNDTELMADLGMHYAWRNRWEEGLPLLREAFARNPAQPSGYRLAFFLDHYLHGRYDEALEEARRIEAPNIIYTHLAMAMALVRTGQRSEAASALRSLLEIDPAYASHAVADLEKRNIHPDLIAVIIDGLRRAGLPVPAEAVSQRS